MDEYNIRIIARRIWKVLELHQKVFEERNFGRRDETIKKRMGEKEAQNKSNRAEGTLNEKNDKELPGSRGASSSKNGSNLGWTGPQSMRQQFENIEPDVYGLRTPSPRFDEKEPYTDDKEPSRRICVRTCSWTLHSRR